MIAAVLKLPVSLAFGLYRGGNRYDLVFETFEDQGLTCRGRSAPRAWPRSSSVTRPGWNITRGRRRTTGSISMISGMPMNNRNPRPRGLPTLLSMLILAAAATASAAPQAADPGASIDSDWVLKILARSAPMRTNFVELRASRLLKEPLRLSGEYQRPDEDTLVRQVRVPYVETTTITTDATAPAHAPVAPHRTPPHETPRCRED